MSDIIVKERLNSLESTLQGFITFTDAIMSRMEQVSKDAFIVNEIKASSRESLIKDCTDLKIGKIRAIRLSGIIFEENATEEIKELMETVLK